MVHGLGQDQCTAGCGADLLVYCPWQGCTRAEGRVSCLRIMNGLDFLPSDPDTPLFGDVPLETWYARWVQAAYAAGLLPPCPTTPKLLFCPTNPLTRAVAAAKMVKAKNPMFP